MAAHKPRFQLLPKSKRPVSLYYAGDINEDFLRVLWQQPQELVLCSPGGEVELTLAALDLLDAVPIDIVATGQCYSAALPVLVSGHRRAATARTRFMWHDSRLTFGDRDRTAAQLVTATQELRVSQDALVEQLARRTSTSWNQWKALVAGGEGDYFFNCQEALRSC